MCTNPRTIMVKASAYDIRCGSGPYKTVTVPCGKCFECLSVRQNKLALRCAKAAEEAGSLQFLTLTYSEEKVPIAQSLWRVETATGEEIRISEPKYFDYDKLGIRKSIQELNNHNKFQQVRVYDKKVSEITGYEYYLRFTPTLHYDDVRLWLKNCRVKYEREKGKKLPDFKYCIVGEYGEFYTKRPHYHCLFFGLNKSQAQYLAFQWYGENNYNFGHVESRFDVPIGDFGKVASYLGKYCAKGPFECSSVREGLTIKSRLCTSKNLGVNLTDLEIKYFRAYDFGKYDVDKFSELSEFDKNLYLSQIHERLYYVIPGCNCKFKLPSNLLRLIFGDKFINNEWKKSSLHYEYSRFVQDSIVQDTQTKLESFISNFPAESLSEAVAAFQRSIYSALQIREQNRRESLRKKLRKAKI